MARLRFALVAFDPDRIRALNWQADAPLVARALLLALQGEDYPRERGLIRVTLLDPQPQPAGSKGKE